MKRKGIDLEPKATSMLADFVGTDLSRLTGELEKLIITLPKGQTRVTPEQIERNIGISKDYNNFELRSAIVEKDVLKANRIIKYFEENPKTNPIQMTLSLLFGFFSNLMLAYYAPKIGARHRSILRSEEPVAVPRISKCHEDVQWNKNHADHRRDTIYRCQV